MAEVTKSIPQKELEQLERDLHEAVSPLVHFTGDLEDMKKKADDQTSQALYRMLGWVKQYSNTIG